MQLMGAVLCRDKMDNIIYNNESLVYHYTSLAVFNAIMEELDGDSLVFHASGMHCVNDTSEFIYGFNEFRKILPAIENGIGDIDNSFKLSALIDKEEVSIGGNWGEAFTHILKEGNKTPFIISTSTNLDYIPMWNMYGDKGCGVAIGLDVANSYHKKNDKENNSIILKGDLSENDIHAYKVVQKLSLDNPAVVLAKSLYEKYLKSVQQDLSEVERKKKMIIALYEMSVLPASLAKHPAFMFEDEWRIIKFASSSDEILYKVKESGSLFPYIKVKIPKTELHQIILGPCCNSPFQKEIIESLLAKNNMSHCKVMYSKVPYR